jgi:hypothetical protein
MKAIICSHKTQSRHLRHDRVLILAQHHVRRVRLLNNCVAPPFTAQAVGAYNQRVQRAEGTHASSAPVRLLHAAAEDTGLEAESVDLVQPSS